MINVTKTYLPPLEEYYSYLEKIWERAWITNSGPLSTELETKLKEYLGIGHVIFCNNGTVALQLAIKVLGLKREVITTPFSYVASVNSLLWENCKPVFVDINPETFCIDAEKIEAAITPDTEAILAVHVYGIPCDIERIQTIATKHNLKVIYDGAHSFGVKVSNESIFRYGDISTTSFHATKLFHTTEGGAIFCNSDKMEKSLMLHRQFGHSGDDYFCLGINGKNSELHAAMGLCNLPRVNWLVDRRKEIFSWYDEMLDELKLQRPKIPGNITYNYAYYPVVFNSEKVMLNVRDALAREEIFCRRYFYPSLNRLPHFKGGACPVSESISSRVLSLPLGYDLTKEDAERICSVCKEEFFSHVSS